MHRTVWFFGLSFIAFCLTGLAETPEGEPFVSVTDPALVQRLEQKGFSFSEMLGAGSGQDNQELSKNPAYRSLVESLKEDLQTTLHGDKNLGVGMWTGHRLFDQRWLVSPAARFELTGVFNRLDRAAFAPLHCGEIRLLYRLAYRTGPRGKEIASRLPMTVNVVFWARDEHALTPCADFAARWSPPAGKAIDEFLLAKDGPLADLKPALLKAVEVNLQAVRWPSTIRPDQGGYAEYELRVFKRLASGLLAPSPLENTPDLRTLKAKPKLKEELRKWVLTPENLDAVDRGIAVIPDKFLARKATSFALHGTSRLANRPFDQLFKAADFAGVDFSKRRYLRSVPALLKRLDDMSCIGCHQGRTIAGFHFLGVDRADTEAGNAIVYAASPHLKGDLPRRRAFLVGVRTGQADPARPFSERAEGEKGDFGAACGLGDPSFSAWTCEAGLACQAYDTAPAALVGRCYPDDKNTSPVAGSPCKVGKMTQNANPKRDKLVEARLRSCGALRVCEEVAVGFPGGMCSGDCDSLHEGEVCGAIALLDAFNRCLLQKQPFATCLREHARPAVQKACSDSAPCRDDYVCARTAAGVGACIPPYFLFQLRVDGHPEPPVS